MDRSVVVIAAAMMLLGGCASGAVRVGPRAPESYQSVGPAEGTACGILLFDFIPIRINSRTARATTEALSRSDGKMLIDTQVRDRWYFVGVGEMLCTDIVGTAVR